MCYNDVGGRVYFHEHKQVLNEELHHLVHLLFAVRLEGVRHARWLVLVPRLKRVGQAVYIQLACASLSAHRASHVVCQEMHHETGYVEDMPAGQLDCIVATRTVPVPRKTIESDVGHGFMHDAAYVGGTTEQCASDLIRAVDTRQGDITMGLVVRQPGNPRGLHEDHSW